MNLSQAFKKYHKAYLLIGYAFLLFVHFILKDRFFPISVLFYATPIPILIALGLLVLILCFKHKIYRSTLLIALIILTFHWLQYYNLSTNSEAIKNENTKILYWNVAKGKKLPVTFIAEKVHAYKPEIIAFVEAPHTTLKNLHDLKVALPDYNFKLLMGAMLVGTTGQISYEKEESLHDSYKINLMKIDTKRGSLNLVITDLTPTVFINKKQPLEYLLKFSKENYVDVIVGDFNLPYESVFFEAYKQNFRSFHNFNNGFTATWPLGIPLLEIDHIWVSKTHQPLLLHKFYSDASDHALLISEFIHN